MEVDDDHISTYVFSCEHSLISSVITQVRAVISISSKLESMSISLGEATCFSNVLSGTAGY